MLTKIFHGNIIGLAFCLLASCTIVFFACNEANALTEEEGSRLIWFDEFNYNGLPDTTKWSYDVGDACDKPAGCGWGNAEKQYYTDGKLENARVEDGILIIEAHKKDKRNSKYTSARLVTKGKGDWKYGRIEIRANLPSGVGTWPAIWMLPTHQKNGGWPNDGEIDIMEHVGYNPDSIFCTVHTKSYNHMLGTQDGGAHMLQSAESEFHVYGIDWDENKIDFLIDDNLVFTFNNQHKTYAEWPFSEPFHLILNLAVGGHWGGKMGIDENIWPQRMLVDWVRVYENKASKEVK